MIRPILLTVFLLISFAPYYAQNAALDTTINQLYMKLPPGLERVLRDYEKGWQNYDEVLLASLFTEDGFILRPKSSGVRGKENILEAYKEAGGALYLRALSFEMADSIAYIIGGYSSSPDKPDKGKFIVTLRQLPDGKWYITADVDNSN